MYIKQLQRDVTCVGLLQMNGNVKNKLNKGELYYG